MPEGNVFHDFVSMMRGNETKARGKRRTITRRSIPFAMFFVSGRACLREFAIVCVAFAPRAVPSFVLKLSHLGSREQVDIVLVKAGCTPCIRMPMNSIGMRCIPNVQSLVTSHEIFIIMHFFQFLNYHVTFRK